MVDIYTLARQLIKAGLPVTISGGEPFNQARAVANLVATIRGLAPKTHIVVYSGYTFEQLLERDRWDHHVSNILYLADVLVDGPYVAELDDDFMQWRGSSNQRAIDLHKSTWTATEVIDLVLLDWDSQVLTVTESGEITGTAGQMTEIFGEGEPARMCGQAT
jgi:organic radical activating enzyme